MDTFKSLMKQKPVATALLIFLAFLIYQPLTRDILFFNNSLLTSLIFEAIWALVVLVFIYMISGSGTLKFTKKGFGYAFKIAWYMIAVHVVLGIFYFINKLNSSGFIPNVGIVLLEVIVFLLFVGIFEEGLFRGLILNAFLAKSGGSFKGVLNAVFLSSLLFGIAHVVPDIFNLFSKPETNSLFTYIQIIEKILQTGIIGFVLAVIYIGNHNFWSIALIHAFDDFGSAGVNFLFQNSQNVNYVNTTSGGLNSIAYLVLIVLLLPAAIYAYFQLKKISLPQFGFFEEPWKPREVKKIKVDK